MLSRDVRLEGFTTADWVRLADVVRPGAESLGARRARRVRLEAETALPHVAVDAEQVTPDSGSVGAGPSGRPSGRRSGGIIAVTTGQRLRKLLSTRDGRLHPKHEPWPESLEALARRHDARWAAELHTGALEDLMDRFADRLRRDQDLLAQMLELMGVLRELESEGALSFWPWRLSQWPVPKERMLLRAFDALCPNGKAVLLGVFEAGELATCLAARRSGTGFDYLVGPAELRPEMGLLSGDWTRDYRHLVRVVETRVAPLAIGCFGELDTFRRLAGTSSPGAWAEAVAARDIILSPVVAALAIPLGVDVGRAALVTLRGLAERVGARAFFGADGPFLPALERVERLPLFDRDLRRLFGFDPFALLRKLLARDTGDG